MEVGLEFRGREEVEQVLFELVFDEVFGAKVSVVGGLGRIEGIPCCGDDLMDAVYPPAIG